MNCRVPVLALLLVFMVACLFSVPAISGPTIAGEHPWTSDRTGDTGGDVKNDVVDPENDTIPLLMDQDDAAAGGEESTSADSLTSVVVQMVTMFAWML